MTSNALLPKTLGFFFSSSRTINIGRSQVLSGNRWTTSTTRMPTHRHHHHHHTHANPFFARACNEEATELSLRRKRHQHVVCEETLVFGPRPARVGMQATTTTTRKTPNSSSTKSGGGTSAATPAVNDVQEDTSRVTTEKTTTKTRHAQQVVTPGTETKTRIEKKSERDHKPEQPPPPPQKGNNIIDSSNTGTVDEARFSMPDMPLPSLEGRGWTFWI